jgi:hypothetical protein
MNILIKRASLGLVNKLTVEHCRVKGAIELISLYMHPACTAGMLRLAPGTDLVLLTPKRGDRITDLDLLFCIRINKFHKTSMDMLWVIGKL